MKEEDKTMKAQKLSIPHHEETLKKDPNLQFNKLQQSEGDLLIQESRLFGDFVAREAILDEEYWTAAWLRAESHWEDRPNERHADNYKRKYADQEYNALNRRCKGYHGQTCTCIVAVKKEDKNVKRTIIKSVVGTLDLSIRYLLQGESFPGERVKAPLFCCPERKESSSRYGYVANLCVAKSARRRGIAVNMLEFAIQSAKSKDCGASKLTVTGRADVPASHQDMNEIRILPIVFLHPNSILQLFVGSRHRTHTGFPIIQLRITIGTFHWGKFMQS